MNPTRSQLGKILIRRRWITDAQLRQAIQHRQRFQWRLGTSLVDIGAVSEEQLVAALSEQLGVPGATVEDLRGVPDEILQLVPAKLARRCEAIPFKVVGKHLYVAMLEVHNLAVQDEIAFASGKTTMPHVANEARIFEALERYYGRECPAIFTRLLGRLDRARHLSSGRATTAARAPDRSKISLWDLPQEDLFREPDFYALPAAPEIPKEPEPAAEEPVRPTAKAPAAPSATRSTSIPLTPQERSRLLSEVVTQPGQQPPEQASEAALEIEQGLVRPMRRDQVGETILHLMSSQFRRVGLFKVLSDRIEGWMFRGKGWDAAKFRSFRLGLREPSAFLNLLQGGQFHLGPLAPSASHEKLADLWGGELPENCLLLPVRLRDRLVTVIFADPGQRGTVGIELDKLQQLATMASSGLEHCIRTSKLSRT